AEQLEAVGRAVAVKILKPWMDSRQVIARFEAERQALALMDHPNIAKVLDAGTTGSPPPPPSPIKGEGTQRPQSFLIKGEGTQRPQPSFIKGDGTERIKKEGEEDSCIKMEGEEDSLPPRGGGLGWGGGRPYFVMELVKGIPITRYCDEHRLTPRERLELLIPVCQAVQHAHQKGII